MISQGGDMKIRRLIHMSGIYKMSVRSPDRICMIRIQIREIAEYDPVMTEPLYVAFNTAGAV